MSLSITEKHVTLILTNHHTRESAGMLIGIGTGIQAI